MYNLCYVCKVILQDSIVVVVLMGTRHSAIRLRAYVQLLYERLGAGTAVYKSADASRKTGGPEGLITIIWPR